VGRFPSNAKPSRAVDPLIPVEGLTAPYTRRVHTHPGCACRRVMARQADRPFTAS
jgi:hypothetical protein